MYSGFGVVLQYLRGEDDDVNTVLAGTATGLLYKSTGNYVNNAWFMQIKSCWEIIGSENIVHKCFVSERLDFDFEGFAIAVKRMVWK